MRIRVLREPNPNERRVAVVPRGVAALVASGHSVSIDAGAGAGAGYPDERYSDAGGEVTTGGVGVVNGLPVIGFILVFDVELDGDVTVGDCAGVPVNADPDPGEVVGVLLA